MNSPLKFIVGILLLLSINLIAQAKEWRGIVPLHSTRVDVEKLLGTPRPPPKDWFYTLNPGRFTYFLDEGVFKYFSRIMLMQTGKIVYEACLRVRCWQS